MSSERQELTEAVGRATQAYQRATDGFDDEVGRALGLNSSDLRCLDWLTERPMTAGQLAAATGLSNAATTTLLDRLEDRGFVRRRRSTDDRRHVLVELAPDGRSALERLYGPMVVDGAGLLARFTDAELRRILGFLADGTELVDRHRAALSARRASGAVRADGADRAGRPRRGS